MLEKEKEMLIWEEIASFSLLYVEVYCGVDENGKDKK